MIFSQVCYTGTADRMVSYVILKIFLGLSFSILSGASQDTLYGMRMPNFSSTGQSGGGSTAGGTGFTSGSSTSGSFGLNGRGRIVGNSIFDPDEHNVMEMQNENMPTGFRQQQTGFSSLMTGPVMTGPSVVSGQMLVTGNDRINGMNSVSMEDKEGRQSQGSKSARPSIPNGNGDSSVKSMQDRQVYRYISVHVPPPEPMIPSRPRPTQSTPKPETHYQIVFIKAPSTSPQELQEIQLPPPPKMKTLVYVLLKKPEMNDFVKINKPPKVKPSKPEVFFIRYKGQKPQKQREQGPMMISSDSGNGNNGTGMQVFRPRTTTSTSRPLNSGGMGLMQSSGGYENAEIADSDFSHDGFNDNEYSLSSYQRNNINQQQQVRSGFTYSPATSHYGIVN